MAIKIRIALAFLIVGMPIATYPALGVEPNDDRRVSISAFERDYAKKHPISEDRLKQEYEKVKAKLGNKEYKVRHIMVETPEKAKSIIAQLGENAQFEKLAEKSRDNGSAQRGGDLGWNVPANFVPPFADALLNLKNGEYTKEPVQTPFGWHVIRLDDTRDLKVPSFEEVKPQLLQRVLQQSIKKAIDDGYANGTVGDDPRVTGGSFKP